MKQHSLADGFEKHRKTIRKEQFLNEMEVIIPWRGLTEVIEPFYPKHDGPGRHPIGIQQILRIHFLQHWFNLSDTTAEEALYDSRVMRLFFGIDLGEEAVPDETTICKFRHLMERHNLCDLKVNRVTIVDASLINAPSSTKNKQKQRDPEMRSTKKGSQWFFGMKAHIGVDSRTEPIHLVATISANVHDSEVIGDLLHGDETRVWGDSAYTGKGDVIGEHAPHAKDFTLNKGSRYLSLSDQERARNRTKLKVRAKVEHLFAVMRRQFGFSKVRYKGLERNAHHLFVFCALVNLVMAKKTLLRQRSPVLQA